MLPGTREILLFNSDRLSANIGTASAGNVSFVVHFTATRDSGTFFSTKEVYFPLELSLAELKKKKKKKRQHENKPSSTRVIKSGS